MRRVHPLAPFGPLAILAAIAAVSWLGCTQGPDGDPGVDPAARIQAEDTSIAPGGGLNEPCGGSADLPCADGLVCLYADGTCDTADAAGTCAIRPQVCATHYLPLCGCDGTTYGNRCDAAIVGATIAHAGACAAGTE